MIDGMHEIGIKRWDIGHTHKPKRRERERGRGREGGRGGEGRGGGRQQQHVPPASVCHTVVRRATIVREIIPRVARYKIARAIRPVRPVAIAGTGAVLENERIARRHGATLSL